jgi:hypothetical protein
MKDKQSIIVGSILGVISALVFSYYVFGTDMLFR